jgi:hypothetical protein
MNRGTHHERLTIGGSPLLLVGQRDREPAAAWRETGSRGKQEGSKLYRQMVPGPDGIMKEPETVCQ